MSQFQQNALPYFMYKKTKKALVDGIEKNIHAL